MILQPLVFPGQTHQSYAEIIFPAGRDCQGGLKRMLQWLDGAGTPLSTLLYVFDELKIWPFVVLLNFW